MALSPKKDVQYVRRKLKVWHEANREAEGYPDRGEKELKRALMRLCKFFAIPIPKLEFYKTFGGVNLKVLGQCTPEGTLELLTPLRYPNFRRWSAVFFHEFGHYIYWANAEKKANEFEKRMMDRF